MKSYYEVLGLTQNATEEEIKTAYRKLSIKFHPDKNEGDKYFEEWSKKINEAYETLGNNAKRKAYDENLKINNTQQNNSHSGSTNSNNSTIAEFGVLSKLRELTPEFLDARWAYIQAQINYDNISSQTVPNKFSATRVLFIVLLFLISGFGLKKTYFNQSAVQQTIQSDKATSSVTAVSGLSIRDQPNKNGNVLTTVPYQEKLTVIETQISQDYINGQSGYWYKVEYQGTTGFAWGNYISK